MFLLLIWAKRSRELMTTATLSIRIGKALSLNFPTLTERLRFVVAKAAAAEMRFGLFVFATPPVVR
jgi:hypothetical protein